MHRAYRLALGLAAACVAASPLGATSLRVAPVTLDLAAPAAASSIRIWNDGPEPVTVQVRIFKWSQREGQDEFEPSDAVVVSPPFTVLQPGGENLVRVVRVSKEPVTREESYRLIVDQLPLDRTDRENEIDFVVRHSLPVFFSPENEGEPVLSWAVEQQDGGYRVTARNSGPEHVRIADLRLGNGGETTLARRPGLVGYVLGSSTMRWFIPGEAAVGASVTIEADTQTGSVNATAPLIAR